MPQCCVYLFAVAAEKLIQMMDEAASTSRCEPIPRARARFNGCPRPSWELVHCGRWWALREKHDLSQDASNPCCCWSGARKSPPPLSTTKARNRKQKGVRRRVRGTHSLPEPLMIPSSCRSRQAKLRKRVSDGSGTMPSLTTCLRSVRLAIPRTEYVSQRFAGRCGGLCWSYDVGRAAACPAQHVTSVKVARLKNHGNWNGHTVTMTLAMAMAMATLLEDVSNRSQSSDPTGM